MAIQRIINLVRTDGETLLVVVVFVKLDTVTGWDVGDSLTLSVDDSDTLFGGLPDITTGHKEVSSGSAITVKRIPNSSVFSANPTCNPDIIVTVAHYTDWDQTHLS